MIACPSCAHDNPDGQKFCGECGVRLPDTSVTADAAEAFAPSYTPPHLSRDVLTSRFAIEGERKLVTVMFCDIANSTPLAARVGAEAMHGLLNRFFELALAEVHRYEGTINQFLGDGFMALFGAPIAHEDHARRALLAATAIQQQMRDAEGEAQELREVRLRMGLNTGFVVVGSIGDNLRMDYTAIGDTTNLAARLQGFAEPGTIRASDTTRRAAEAHFSFRDLGRHPLKGIAAPLPIFEPIRPRAPGEAVTGTMEAQVGSVLVGREAELAAVSRSLADLRKGRGGVVVIKGEPGAGKSRLVTETRRSNAAKGVLWLEGRSLSFGRSLSYWPFIDILKGAFGIAETDPEAEAFAKLEAAVRGLFDDRAPEIVPYVATVMALPLTAEHEARVKFLDAQAMKRQVFLSMRQLAECIAQRQPVLVVIEDWHWVDQSSIALLEHLLPLAASRPITFWLTTRAEPAEPVARIRAAVSANTSIRLDEIALMPLAQEHSRALIANLVGDLPEAVRAQIQRRTGGNPFFIEEVVRALIADGTLMQDARAGGWRLARPVAELVIPDTVQGVIVARIDQLEDSVKSVLKLASVIGRHFFLRILKAIAEATDNVERGLGTLEAAELIRMRRQVPELEYIFKHALVQEAAYGSILAERRRAIHRSVGSAIESLFADRQDEFASLLAYHYALAEDWEKAQAYLLKAGDQAGRIAADAEALEHYRQAEAVFMKLAGREVTPLQRASMDRKLGQAYYGVGDYDQAVAHFTRALAQLGIDYPRSRGDVRRRILRYIAAQFMGRLVRGLIGARRPTLEPAVAKEISTICQSLAWLDYLADDDRFALDSLIELFAGERGGDVLGQVRGLSTLGIAYMSLGAQRLAGSYIAEAIARAQASGHSAAIGTAELAGGMLSYARGALAQSAQHCHRSAGAYKDIGDIRGWGAPTSYLWLIAYELAEFGMLASQSSELLRVGEGARDPHVKSWGILGHAQHALSVGPLDAAVRFLTEARDTSEVVSSFRVQATIEALLGRSLLRQGRFEEASIAFRRHVSLIKSRSIGGVSFNSYAEFKVSQVERLGVEHRRLALREAAEACRKAKRSSRDVAPWQSDTRRIAGTLAWLSGNGDAAKARWRECLELAKRYEQPLAHARALAEMGQRLGDTATLQEAIDLFQKTGAKVDLAFSLHALARMAAAATGSETEAALSHCDQAILALDAVKAEYNLGLACRERAQLIAKLGRHNEANADLARARLCFASVGADAERIATEKMALTHT